MSSEDKSPATKADLLELRTELKQDICELRSEMRELEGRIDTKIEVTVSGAVTQILTAFDMKMDQVRSDMVYADEHNELKTRVSNLEKSVFE